MMMDQLFIGHRLIIFASVFFFACIIWQVSPAHPMSSPVLVINGDGCICIIAISANGILYRRNYYTDLIVTDERNGNGIFEIVNVRGLFLRP